MEWKVELVADLSNTWMRIAKKVRLSSPQHHKANTWKKFITTTIYKYVLRLIVNMGWHIQRYIAKAGRAVNPLTWYRVWKTSEGKQLSDVARSIAYGLNNEFAQIGRVSQYRYWWWANPLGAGLVVYGMYKFWYLSYMAHKQRKVAQVVAGAYGQGGQWLNPVPK